jgi:hypothetical protein
MTGSGQARLRGPTNGFAAPHETRDHLVGSLVVEASRTFVNKDNPIWDVNGIDHDSVNPSKCVISWPRFIDMKMDTHIPCTVLWLLYAINASHSFYYPRRGKYIQHWASWMPGYNLTLVR